MKKKKKNVKKLFRRKNNTNNDDDHGEICVSRVLCSLLSSPSGSTPGNVRWCPSLALGNRVETTSDWSLWLSPLCLAGSHCSALAGFPSVQGPGVVHLVSEITASTTSTCLQRAPLVWWRRWNPWVTSGGHCSVFKEDGGSVSPPPPASGRSVPDYFQ